MTKPSEDPLWQNLTHKERVRYLEKHRDVNVEFDWWGSVYEMFIEDMEQIGIQVMKDDITFSGFWSQGDGAAFAGYVSDWAKMFKHLGLLLKLDFYRDSLEYMTFRSARPHNNCMVFKDDFQPGLCPDHDEDPLRHRLWELSTPTEKELCDLESTLREVFEGAAKKLYKDLEAEYDYLTDDEQIIEYVLEHEFEEAECE